MKCQHITSQANKYFLKLYSSSRDKSCTETSHIPHIPHSSLSLYPVPGSGMNEC